MLPVTDDNFCCTVCSTLRFASLNAAATRSSSISLSSPSNESSIVTRRTSCLHVTTTFTMPPPATPSTSVAASSSWAFCMLACISCACRINWLKPFIDHLSAFFKLACNSSRSFARANAVVLERRIERGLHGFHVRVGFDRFARLAHAPALVLATNLGRRCARRLTYGNREPEVSPILLAKRRFEARTYLKRVQVLAVGRYDKLPRAARVRLEIATIGELTREPAKIERLHDAGPVGCGTSNSRFRIDGAIRCRRRLRPACGDGLRGTRRRRRSGDRLHGTRRRRRRRRDDRLHGTRPGRWCGDGSAAHGPVRHDAVVGRRAKRQHPQQRHLEAHARLATHGQISAAVQRDLIIELHILGRKLRGERGHGRVLLVV